MTASNRGKKREYTLEFRARIFSRLPWPTRRTFMSKVTTWSEVNDLANALVEAGCTGVAIHWTKDDE